MFRHSRSAWCARIAALLGACALAAGTVSAQTTLVSTDNYASETAGQVLTSALPVTVSGREFAAAPAKVTVDKVMAVSPAGLAQSLSSVLSKGAHDALMGLGADFVNPEQLVPLGLTVLLDKATLSLSVEIAPAARAPTNVSLLSNFDPRGAILVRPSRFSLGVTTALTVQEVIDDGQEPGLQLPFEGFVNVGGLKGVTTVFGGTGTRVQGTSRFQRAPIFAFRDNTDNAIRISAGELFTPPNELGGSTGLLGLQIERNYETLQPTRNIRPTGQRSFFLDRRSVVEVTSNGQLISRFIANPGPVDLNNIALSDLNNNVTISVEDDLGRRTIDRFLLVNDLSLLGKGLTEFSAGVGVLGDPSDRLRYTNEAVGTAEFRSGITEALTIGANGTVSEELYTGGALIGAGVARGVLLAQANGSRAPGVGNGYGVSLAYRGGPYFGRQLNDTLNLLVQYASRNFANLSDRASTANQQLSVAGDYRIDLPTGVSVNIGGDYSRQYDVPNPIYGAFAGLSFQIKRINIALTGRYRREFDGRDRVGALLTVSRAIGRRTFARANYDSLTRSSRFELSRPRSLQNPDYDYRLEASNTRDGTQLSGTVGVTTARATADASVFQAFTPEGGRQNEVVTGRIQTGFGFAGGAFGIGSAAGRGFALFDSHQSLDDARIEVFAASGTQKLASSGAFGPALSRIIAPYRPDDLQVRVRNAPPGYDVGPGRYALISGARTGTRVTVGVEDFRSVAVTLTFGGQPVELVFGTYARVGSDQTQSFFTNRTGRALFSRLAPGQYVARIPTLGLEYTFTVGDRDEAFVDRGSVAMEQK